MFREIFFSCSGSRSPFSDESFFLSRFQHDRMQKQIGFKPQGHPKAGPSVSAGRGKPLFNNNNKMNGGRGGAYTSAKLGNSNPKKGQRGGYSGNASNAARGGRAYAPFGKMKPGRGSASRSPFAPSEDDVDKFALPVNMPSYYIPEGSRYPDPFLTVQEMLDGGLHDIFPSGEFKQSGDQAFARTTMKLLLNDGKSTNRRPLIEAEVISEYGISEKKKKENEEEEDGNNKEGWSVGVEGTQNELLSKLASGVQQRVKTWAEENKAEIAKYYGMETDKLDVRVKCNFRQSTKSKATNKPYRWTFSVYPGITGVGLLTPDDEDKKDEKTKNETTTTNPTDSNEASSSVPLPQEAEKIQLDYSWYAFVQENLIQKAGKYIIKFVIDHLDWTGGGDAPVVISIICYLKYIHHVVEPLATKQVTSKLCRVTKVIRKSLEDGQLSSLPRTVSSSSSSSSSPPSTVSPTTKGQQQNRDAQPQPMQEVKIEAKSETTNAKLDVETNVLENNMEGDHQEAMETNHQGEEEDEQQQRNSTPDPENQENVSDPIEGENEEEDGVQKSQSHHSLSSNNSSNEEVHPLKRKRRMTQRNKISG